MAKNCPEWKKIKEGAKIDPKTSPKLKTGGWGTHMPLRDHKICTRCQQCAVNCPDFCLYKDKKTNRFFKKKTKIEQEKNLSSKQGLLSLVKQQQELKQT